MISKAKQEKLKGLLSFIVGWWPWFQNVVPRPAASASPRNLLEMQILRPPSQTRITNSGGVALECVGLTFFNIVLKYNVT